MTYKVTELCRIGDWVVSLTEVYEGGHTKGHRHKCGQDEVYLWVDGNGRVVLKSPQDDVEDCEINESNKFALVRGEFAHRAVNVGEGTFSFISIYRSDTEKYYNVRGWQSGE